mgnify:CR=1 FL=1
MKKKIAIIGAGISGLVFTNLLKKKSKFEFCLYEKNNSIDLKQSYGIQLAVNSVSILNEINFKNFSADEKCNPKKIDFYSLKNGSKICDLDITKFNFENVSYTSLKRSSLVKFLRDNLFANTIQFNKKIKKINFSNFKIEIDFDDNSSDVVDYIVISDGVFSPTKSILFKKDIKLNYSGSLAIRATLTKKDIKFLDQNNISLFLGPNFHLVFYPLGKKNEFNLIGVAKKKLNEEVLYDRSFFENGNKVKKILDETSIKQNYNLINLFTNAQNLKCFPIFFSNKALQPNQKNVFFLGDAFFALPPTFGQGASQAIESAYELFKILDSKNIDSFNSYYKTRIKRIQMIHSRSRLNYFAFHLSNPILVLIRNIILKAIVTNRKFLNKYLGKIYLRE